MSEPFQPQPVDLPDIPTADISWDVRIISDEQGWTWDDEIGRYVDSDGTPVTEAEIMAVVEAELADWESLTQELTDSLIDGTYDVRDWEQAIAEIIAAVAAIFFLFGLGSIDKLTDEHTEFANERLQTQYEYLRAFSEAVLAGTLSAAMIGARAKLYVHDAESNHGYAQDFAHDTNEFPFYSNVLGSTRPCEQCPRETAKGIVTRGSLPAIGNRLCLSRCHCHFAYYRSQDEPQRETLKRFGWLGQDSLTIPIVESLT